MSDPIRVAHCGLGKWGPNILRNLLELEEFDVTTLCDTDESRLKEFSTRVPGASIHIKLDNVLQHEDVDAVVLATPAGLHADQVTKCLKAGKHVFVEKPLALTLDKATELTRLARECKRTLMVGHTFLFNPSVLKVKEQLDSGKLGNPQFILAQRMSLGRIREDCNALWNLAPHDISILLYWLDKLPSKVCAQGVAFHQGHKQEDIALCTLEFPGPVLASVQVSWLNPIKVRQMTIVGSESMLIYDDVNTKNPVTIYHQRAEEVPADIQEGGLDRFFLEIKPGKSNPLTVEWREPLSVELGHFYECIQSGKTPIGSGTDALRITSVLEALDQSLKQSGKYVVPEKTW